MDWWVWTLIAIVFFAFIGAIVVVAGMKTNWFRATSSTNTITAASSSNVTTTPATTTALSTLSGTPISSATAAVSTIAPTTTAPAVTSAPYLQYVNHTLLGDDLVSSNTDPQTCQALCNNRKDCTHFVSDWKGTFCQLRKNPRGFQDDPASIAYAPASVGTPAPSTISRIPFFNWNIESSNSNIGGGQAVSDASGCATLCTRTAGCNAYVTTTDGKTCWLKSAGDLTWNQGNFASYVPSGMLPPYSSWQGVDSPGNDISNTATDPTTCALNCGANPNCQGFITDNAGSQCWLKSGVAPGNWSNNRNVHLLPSIGFNPPATIYKDDNFSGQAATVQVGEYGWIVNDVHFPNDAISSVRVPQGYTLILYDNAGFGGASTTLKGDNSSLRSVGFNDRTSSLKYFKS